MGKEKGKTFWILILVIFWLVFVLGGYYNVHKPLSPEKLSPILNSLINLLLFPVFVLFFGGIGRKIFAFEDMPATGRMVLQFSLGAGVFSFFWLLVGLAGLYYRWAAWTVLILGLIFLRKSIYSWGKEYVFSLLQMEKIKKTEKILVFFIAGLLLIQLLITLSPPVKYDALTYHLDLPRYYAEVKSFGFMSQNPYWGHPQLVEILYTFVYLLLGENAAALLGWGAGVIVLAGVNGLTNGVMKEVNPKSESKMPGLIAVGILLSAYTFRFMFSWAYTDLFSALFGLCTLLLFIHFLKSYQEKLLYLSGMFAGFALGTKWTAALILLPLLLWLIPDLLKAKLKFRVFVIWGCVFSLVSLPWFLKNFFFSGNPLYPYFFPTSWVSEFRLLAASTSPPEQNLLKYILAPITMTWFGVDSSPGFGADIGPLFLLFIPFSLWKFKKEKIVKMFGLCLLTCWGSILLGSVFFEHLQQTRLYFVFLPCAAVCAGLGWAAVQPLKSVGIRIGLVLNGMLIMVFIFMGFQDLTDRQLLRSISYLGGNTSQQGYLEESLGWYARAMMHLEELPDESNVLMLWEGRGFYAPEGVDADPWIDAFRVCLSENPVPQEMVLQWESEGYSYLLINMSGVNFLRENPGSGWQEDWEAFDSLLAYLPQPVSIGDVYYLYELPLSE